jgi:hypothetical protein
MTTTTVTTLGLLHVPALLSKTPFTAPTHRFCIVEPLSFFLVIQLDRTKAKASYVLPLYTALIPTLLPTSLEDFSLFNSLGLKTTLPTGEVKHARYKESEYYFNPELVHPLVVLAEEISTAYNIRTFLVGLATGRVNQTVLSWKCDPSKSAQLGTWFPTTVSKATALSQVKGFISLIKSTPGLNLSETKNELIGPIIQVTSKDFV